MDWNPGGWTSIFMVHKNIDKNIRVPSLSHWNVVKMTLKNILYTYNALNVWKIMKIFVHFKIYVHANTLLHHTISLSLSWWSVYFLPHRLIFVIVLANDIK